MGSSTRGDAARATTSDIEDSDDSSSSNFLLWKCPICLDTLVRPVLTTCCGQSFCDGCLSAALAKVDACPMCREPLLAGGHSATRNRTLEDILARLPPSMRDRSDAADADRNSERHVLIQIDDVTSDDHTARDMVHEASRFSLCNALARARKQLVRFRLHARARSGCSAVQLRQWRHWCRVHWSSLQCVFYVVLFFVFVSFLRVQEDEFAEHKQ